MGLWTIFIAIFPLCNKKKGCSRLQQGQLQSVTVCCRHAHGRGMEGPTPLPQYDTDAPTIYGESREMAYAAPFYHAESKGSPALIRGGARGRAMPPPLITTTTTMMKMPSAAGQPRARSPGRRSLSTPGTITRQRWGPSRER